MSQPEPDLSTAARDEALSPAAASLMDSVREYAERHPTASRRGLVLLLARKWIPDMLRWKWRA